MTWLLLAVVVVGIPTLGLLTDLCLLDTVRTKARVDAIIGKAEHRP